MSEGWRYTLAALGLYLLVGIASRFLISGAELGGVVTGATIALVVQILGFWLLFVWLLPHRRLLAYGMGMLLRFTVLGIVALVWLPNAGVPFAPTLFSLVAVMFLTTLLEPLVWRGSHPVPPGPSPAAG